jgi:hypothetical protein
MIHVDPLMISILLLGHAVHPSTMGLRCVVRYGNIRDFLAAMCSLRERCTWAHCCVKGESINKGFRMSGVVLLGEKNPTV